jgi:DNA-binding CsgD family transcriptional regulator
MPSVGDVTYRLTVRHAWSGSEAGLKLLRVNCAFELYADGRLVAKAGTLSDAAGGFAGGYAPQSVYFIPASGLTTLVLRVSNRIPGAWSGALDEIVMGPRKAIEAEANGSFFADTFNVCGRLIFVMIFAALFALTRSQLALTFSAANLIMALRISASREMILLRVFPSIQFSAFVRIFILSSILALTAVLCWLEAYLREGGKPEGESRASDGVHPRSRGWILGGLGATSLVSTLYLTLVPDSAFLRYFEILMLPACACYFYYMWTIFSYARHRRLGAGVMGIYLLMFYYTTFEILCQLRVIDQGYMYPMFFLKAFPTLAGLATVQVQQGIVSYLNIASIGFFFLYDILRRRLPKSMAAQAPPEPPAERESRLDELTRLRGLSEREMEILAMAARGLSYEAIAEACFISKHTVKTHLGNIYRKLEVKSKAELASKIAGLM